MVSLIFGTVQESVTAYIHATHTISNHQINNPRYGRTWDISYLYDQWRERAESNLFSIEELQVKLATLLMPLCFVRMEKMAIIDLSGSIIDGEEHTAAKYISTRLERLIDSLGIKGATVNSIRCAISTKFTAQGFDRMIENVITHRTPDSKMNKECHIFAVNREQDSITSALVKNHGEKQATQIISKQRGDARVSERDGLQQSPLGDDLQLSPQETLALPLSS
ncbi:MAG: hypothetical protein EZS28_004294 [Streblomastix strix]|uniref:Uncharacterized protein n=1 Tax=Streblomastix strix TaxID=222440 RepID=A0A5J4X0A3_9EUKA|nr:MAG: hypothetical protein EZS28_004294 [Streblomastix strix]